MPSLVLIEPDIPQNLGGVLRLGACLRLPLHVIEPCGFPLDDTRMRRAGMDYMAHAELHRHASWERFLSATYGKGTPEAPPRKILIETDGAESLENFAFEPNDYLIFGSESRGTPRALYGEMDVTLRIPMRPELRSLNLAMSAGMVAFEAWRQLRWDL